MREIRNCNENTIAYMHIVHVCIFNMLVFAVLGVFFFKLIIQDIGIAKLKKIVLVQQHRIKNTDFDTVNSIKYVKTITQDTCLNKQFKIAFIFIHISYYTHCLPLPYFHTNFPYLLMHEKNIRRILISILYYYLYGVFFFLCKILKPPFLTPHAII